MADINHVSLVGRLTRDADLKYTNSGQAVSNISLAVNQRRRRDNEWIDEAHFFDCVLWGKSAEALNSYLVKGKQVGVEGQLRQNRWEQEGRTRSKVEISVNNIQLLGTRSDGPTSINDSIETEASSVSTNKPTPEEFDDDIPF